MAHKLSCSVACGNLSTPCAQSLSHVWLFVTLWTVACQAPLSIGFSQQEYWSGLPFPPPGNLPEPGIEPMSPVLTGRFFSTVPSGESLVTQFSSVQLLSCIWLFAIPWTAASQACSSPAPSVYSNSCPLSVSQWCHPSISSSVVPFSSCTQSFPASGSFQMSPLFTSGGQSITVSASTSVLPVSTQDWSLGWTGWISLQSRGLSRVFSNTTVQKHQFFGAQLSL